jgi:transposase
MEPFRAAREFLTTIPGISLKVADVIIAETGADMSRFETPGRLASWTGVCPGANESAGRIKSAHIMPGNKYLKGALGIAALSASRTKNTYLAAKYWRIAARRGPMKATVALEHSILTAVWHMLADGECYADPGSDHFTLLDPTKAKNNAIKKLNSLGFNVTITPATAA